MPLPHRYDLCFSCANAFGDCTTGCAVCYLPVKRAIKEQPKLTALIELKEAAPQTLTYVTDSGADSSELDALHRGEAPSFAGH